MEAIAPAHGGDIRQIEDIIDIQKANGTINKHVAFNLPVEVEDTISAGLARSVESGLSKAKSGHAQKKFKNYRAKRQNQNASVAEVVSWPSDSDITVLRMKLSRESESKDNVGNLVTGDGLHHPDSSSMINLATLMVKSQSPSKVSLETDEYLMPLSSWGQRRDSPAVQNDNNEIKDENENVESYSDGVTAEKTYSGCESGDERPEKSVELKDRCTSAMGKKSKIAKFLRLYFCPCSSRLYKMETMQEQPSTYRSKKCE